MALLLAIRHFLASKFTPATSHRREWNIYILDSLEVSAERFLRCSLRFKQEWMNFHVLGMGPEHQYSIFILSCVHLFICTSPKLRMAQPSQRGPGCLLRTACPGWRNSQTFRADLRSSPSRYQGKIMYIAVVPAKKSVTLFVQNSWVDRQWISTM